MRIPEEVRDVYRTIYGQGLSGDGNSLIVGDNYGTISVFDFCQNWRNVEKFQTGLDCVYDLKVVNDVVVCAGDGGIEACKFDQTRKTGSTFFNRFKPKKRMTVNRTVKTIKTKIIRLK